MPLLDNIFSNRKIGILVIVVFGVISFLGLIENALGVGLLLVAFLTLVTFFIMRKLDIVDKEPYIIFLIALAIHLLAILFIYYTGFRPFGGGADFEGYHTSAVEISQRFSHGDFSLLGLKIKHFFPILVGVLYIFTLPQMIVGQLFIGFFAGLSAMLVYFLARQIGSFKQLAFLAGLVTSIYPSYLYFGSVLLKDTIVVPLVLASLLLAVMIYKRALPWHFFGFFVFLTILIHLRFYVGFAMMFSFIICWFVLSFMPWNKRIAYGLLIVVLLGFSPYFLGYGYYGLTPLVSYLNKDVITRYREIVYAPSADFIAQKAKSVKKEVAECLAINSCPIGFGATNPIDTSLPNANTCLECINNKGNGSSFVVSAGFDSPLSFIKNYVTSFVYSVFGPFPWQLTLKRHLFFLTETIPWYLLCLLFSYNVAKYIKKEGRNAFFKKYAFSAPLLLFVIIAFGALSLYINNFGIIIRIRMPMWIVLLCIISLSMPEYDYIGTVKMYLKKIVTK